MKAWRVNCLEVVLQRSFYRMACKYIVILHGNIHVKLRFQYSYAWLLLAVEELVLKKYNATYVSIISDCFLVRSVTIHHILQSNEKRNIFGSIWHVSCFHLERYYKMIKIVYYVIHINFPIKSIDSC